MKISGKQVGYYKETPNKKEFVEMYIVEDNLLGMIVNTEMTNMRKLYGTIEGNTVKGTFQDIDPNITGEFEFIQTGDKLEGFFKLNDISNEYIVEIKRKKQIRKRKVKGNE